MYIKEFLITISLILTSSISCRQNHKLAINKIKCNNLNFEKSKNQNFRKGTPERNFKPANLAGRWQSARAQEDHYSSSSFFRRRPSPFRFIALQRRYSSRSIQSRFCFANAFASDSKRRRGRGENEGERKGEEKGQEEWRQRSKASKRERDGTKRGTARDECSNPFNVQPGTSGFLSDASREALCAEFMRA